MFLRVVRTKIPSRVGQRAVAGEVKKDVALEAIGEQLGAGLANCLPIDRVPVRVTVRQQPAIVIEAAVGIAAQYIGHRLGVEDTARQRAEVLVGVDSNYESASLHLHFSVPSRDL